MTQNFFFFKYRTLKWNCLSFQWILHVVESVLHWLCIERVVLSSFTHLCTSKDFSIPSLLLLVTIKILSFTIMLSTNPSSFYLNIFHHFFATNILYTFCRRVNHDASEPYSQQQECREMENAHVFPMIILVPGIPRFITFSKKVYKSGCHSACRGGFYKPQGKMGLQACHYRKFCLLP